MLLSPSVRDLKTLFNPMTFSYLLGLFGSISIHSLLFYPPPPLCPAPSFSPTPLLHPFSLHCVRCVRVNIRSCLPSSLALLPNSVSSPLASCLSSMSFLAWLYLSLKSTLLFFAVLFFFYSDTDIESHHSLHPNILILTLSSRIRPPL